MRQTIGKTAQEICALTEKGLAYLLSQANPKQVLEDLVRTLEARQVQVGELVAAARKWQAGLDALQATVEKVLQQMQSVRTPSAAGGALGPRPSTNGSDSWVAALLAFPSAQRLS